MNPFETIIAWFREKVQEIQAPRTGKNCQYSLDDILISALAVFFVQDGSFLAFQKKMEIEYQASNMKNLFGVANIPTDDQIRNIRGREYPYGYPPAQIPASGTTAQGSSVGASLSPPYVLRDRDAQVWVKVATCQRLE